MRVFILLIAFLSIRCGQPSQGQAAVSLPPGKTCGQVPTCAVVCNQEYGSCGNSGCPQSVQTALAACLASPSN